MYAPLGVPALHEGLVEALQSTILVSITDTSVPGSVFNHRYYTKYLCFNNNNTHIRLVVV